MEDEEFMWDDENAAAHYAKHGVSFDSAKAVFSDPFAIDIEDVSQRYADARRIIIGMAYERVLFVAYTLIESRVRIISAREAEPHERRKYHE
jgi:uncharacterized DUF497 family protein